LIEVLAFIKTMSLDVLHLYAVLVDQRADDIRKTALDVIRVEFGFDAPENVHGVQVNANAMIVFLHLKSPLNIVILYHIFQQIPNQLLFVIKCCLKSTDGVKRLHSRQNCLTYEAAARAGGGYLMLAAPLVAISAVVFPVLWDHCLAKKRGFRALVLFLAWLPCAAVVFYAAAERVHLSKAGAESERHALRAVAERAATELTEAKTALAAATVAANKVRGLTDKQSHKTCLSIRATEIAAQDRVRDAEGALKAAEATAVTESNLKAADWLLPLSLNLGGLVLVWTGLAPATKTSEAPVPPTKRQEAARRGHKTPRRNARIRAKTRETGRQLVKAS
jgi:hypothetical protein